MKYMNKAARNLCLLQQAFKVHFVSKVMCIHFINGNNIGLICNSMVCCSPRTITIFLPALLALLIPNTTANHTITYTNNNNNNNKNNNNNNNNNYQGCPLRYFVSVFVIVISLIITIIILFVLIFL